MLVLLSFRGWVSRRKRVGKIQYLVHVFFPTYIFFLLVCSVFSSPNSQKRWRYVELSETLSVFLLAQLVHSTRNLETLANVLPIIQNVYCVRVLVQPGFLIYFVMRMGAFHSTIINYQTSV